ncbi:MAG: hypothetical protein SGARI_006130 [Bacillariaceae sp.]
MARTVLKWKLNASLHDGDIPHWTTLSKLNNKVVELIQQLASSSSPVSTQDFDALALLPASEWPQDSPLTALHKTFSDIRRNLKALGEEAGVPIEPPPQTAVCDSTMRVPGVVAALVPGAGGYDAVACVYIDRREVHEAIGALWAQWETPIICPLAVKANQSGLRVEA